MKAARGGEALRAKQLWRAERMTESTLLAADREDLLHLHLANPLQETCSSLPVVNKVDAISYGSVHLFYTQLIVIV
jgi:hypothetical protein